MNEELKDKLLEKVNYFGIDIDSGNVFDFLMAYLKIKHDFPDARIESRLSSSHSGYHIIVNLKEPITLVEGFLYRGAYGDCLNRLKLNFAKLLASGGKEEENDILFDKKQGKKVIPLRIDELLKPHEEKISGILENWGDEGLLNVIKEIADKIEPKIPKKSKFIVGIGISTDIQKEKLKKVCEDISKVDEGFRYKIYQSFVDNYKYILTIFVKDKNEAHKKGCWFINKTGIDGLLYWVKELN